MKTIFKIMITLISLYSISSGQLIRDWGIKGGVASSSQTWKYSPNFDFMQNTKSKSGADIGLFVEWLNGTHLSILTEARYIQRGVDDNEKFTSVATGRDTIMTLSARIDYLSIPILVKYRFEIGNIAPYVIIGPRIDILLDTKSDWLSHTMGQLSAIDYGANIGCGLEYTIPDGLRFGIEFQYCPSFRKVFDNGILTVQNHSMEFLAFIAF